MEQAFVRLATQYASTPCKLAISLYLFTMWHVGYLRHQQQVDLLTLKVVSESRVTWATSVSILVLGFSVLELSPMYATDRRQTDGQTNVRQTDVRQKHRLLRRRHNNTI